MFFLPARRACGVRDGRVNVGVEFEKGLDQTGFAGAAGGCHYKEISWVIHG